MNWSKMSFQYKDQVDPDKNLYPLYLYIYDENGFHSIGVRLDDKQKLEYAFKTSIKFAIANKREVRITDSDDLLCFHAKDGKILYDGERHYV